MATGCTNDQAEDREGLTEVSFVLDWTPNTNHTGVYVAMEKGFYEDAGIAVDIILPGEVQPEQLLASGKADIGVSYQTELTQARAEGLDVVSIGAIIQHNTSGYAAPVDKGITRPKDFAGHVYGAYGSSIEEARLQAMMEPDGGDIDEVSTIILRESDFFAAVERDIDFASIFYGWTGIEAELRGEELDMIYVADYVDALDSYEPILATSEQMIEEQPDVLHAFMEATTKGFEFAMEAPEEAAEMLIKHEPDLDEELVLHSQQWLADKYQDDASQWGIQEEMRWEEYTEFLIDHRIIEKNVDARELFTNEFLPDGSK